MKKLWRRFRNWLRGERAGDWLNSCLYDLKNDIYYVLMYEVDCHGHAYGHIDFYRSVRERFIGRWGRSEWDDVTNLFKSHYRPQTQSREQLVTDFKNL